MSDLTLKDLVGTVRRQAWRRRKPRPRSAGTIKADPRRADYKPKLPRNQELQLRGLVNHSRKNARVRGIRFYLDYSHVEALFIAQGGACAVSGLPFSLERHGGLSRRPWVPSLDRIDSARAYSLGNVRLVCCAVNLAMNEWGEDVFMKIVGAVANR